MAVKKVTKPRPVKQPTPGPGLKQPSTGAGNRPVSGRITRGTTPSAPAQRSTPFRPTAPSGPGAPAPAPVTGDGGGGAPRASAPALDLPREPVRMVFNPGVDIRRGDPTRFGLSDILPNVQERIAAPYRYDDRNRAMTRDERRDAISQNVKDMRDTLIAHGMKAGIAQQQGTNAPTMPQRAAALTSGAIQVFAYNLTHPLQFASTGLNLASEAVDTAGIATSNIPVVGNAIRGNVAPLVGAANVLMGIGEDTERAIGVGEQATGVDLVNRSGLTGMARDAATLNLAITNPVAGAVKIGMDVVVAPLLQRAANAALQQVFGEDAPQIQRRQATNSAVELLAQGVVRGRMMGANTQPVEQALRVVAQTYDVDADAALQRTEQLVALSQRANPFEKGNLGDAWRAGAYAYEDVERMLEVRERLDQGDNWDDIINDVEDKVTFRERFNDFTGQLVLDPTNIFDVAVGTTGRVAKLADTATGRYVVDAAGYADEVAAAFRATGDVPSASWMGRMTERIPGLRRTLHTREGRVLQEAGDLIKNLVESIDLPNAASALNRLDGWQDIHPIEALLALIQNPAMDGADEVAQALGLAPRLATESDARWLRGAKVVAGQTRFDPLNTESAIRLRVLLQETDSLTRVANAWTAYLNAAEEFRNADRARSVFSNIFRPKAAIGTYEDVIEAQVKAWQSLSDAVRSVLKVPEDEGITVGKAVGQVLDVPQGVARTVQLGLSPGKANRDWLMNSAMMVTDGINNFSSRQSVMDALARRGLNPAAVAREAAAFGNIKEKSGWRWLSNLPVMVRSRRIEAFSGARAYLHAWENVMRRAMQVGRGIDEGAVRALRQAIGPEAADVIVAAATRARQVSDLNAARLIADIETGGVRTLNPELWQRLSEIGYADVIDDLLKEATSLEDLALRLVQLDAEIDAQDAERVINFRPPADSVEGAIATDLEAAARTAEGLTDAEAGPVVTERLQSIMLTRKALEDAKAYAGRMVEAVIDNAAGRNLEQRLRIAWENVNQWAPGLMARRMQITGILTDRSLTEAQQIAQLRTVAPDIMGSATTRSHAWNLYFGWVIPAYETQAKASFDAIVQIGEEAARLTNANVPVPAWDSIRRAIPATAPQQRQLWAELMRQAEAQGVVPKYLTNILKKEGLIPAERTIVRPDDIADAATFDRMLNALQTRVDRKQAEAAAKAAQQAVDGAGDITEAYREANRIPNAPQADQVRQAQQAIDKARQAVADATTFVQEQRLRILQDFWRRWNITDQNALDSLREYTLVVPNDLDINAPLDPKYLNDADALRTSLQSIVDHQARNAARTYILSQNRDVLGGDYGRRILEQQTRVFMQEMQRMLDDDLLPSVARQESQWAARLNKLNQDVASAEQAARAIPPMPVFSGADQAGRNAAPGQTFVGPTDPELNPMGAQAARTQAIHEVLGEVMYQLSTRAVQDARPLDAAQKEAIRTFTQETQRRIGEARLIANYAGNELRDFILGNYSDKRDIDKALGMLYNYPTWYTRMAVSYARRLATNPGAIAAWLKMDAAMRRGNRDLPEWYQDQLRLDTPMGTFYMPIQSAINPLNSFLGSKFRDPDRQVTPYGAMLDELSQYGPGLHTTIALAMHLDAKRRGAKDEMMSWLNYLGAPGRAFKAGSALLRDAGLSFIPPGGFNLAPWMWGQNTEVNADQWGAFQGMSPQEIKRVGAKLAEMVRAGEITHAQAVDASVTQTGPIWADATQRASVEVAPGVLASFFIGPAFRGRPEIETEIARMDLEASELYRRRSDGTAEDKFSVEEERLAWQEWRRRYDWGLYVAMARRDRDRRDRMLAYDVIDRLPPGAGAYFQDIGIPPELYDLWWTQDWNDLSPAQKEQFNVGVRHLAAILDMPDRATVDEWRTAKDQYTAMRRTLEREFGTDIFDRAAYYGQLRERDDGGEAAKAYLQANPEVEAYWERRNNLIMGDPYLKAYYTTIDTVENYLTNDFYADMERQYPGVLATQDEYYRLRDIDAEQATAFLEANPVLKAFWQERNRFDLRLRDELEALTRDITALQPRFAELRADLPAEETLTPNQRTVKQMVAEARRPMGDFDLPADLDAREIKSAIQLELDSIPEGQWRTVYRELRAMGDFDDTLTAFNEFRNTATINANMGDLRALLAALGSIREAQGWALVGDVARNAEVAGRTPVRYAVREDFPASGSGRGGTEDDEDGEGRGRRGRRGGGGGGGGGRTRVRAEAYPPAYPAGDPAVYAQVEAHLDQVRATQPLIYSWLMQLIEMTPEQQAAFVAAHPELRAYLKVLLQLQWITQARLALKQQLLRPRSGARRGGTNLRFSNPYL